MVLEIVWPALHEAHVRLSHLYSPRDHFTVEFLISDPWRVWKEISI